MNGLKVMLQILFAYMWVLGAEPSSEYEKVVKPLFQARCLACHGALKQNGNLRLDTVASMLKGGKHGPVIQLQKPEQSELLVRIRSHEETEKMPPDGEPVEALQILAIEKWIRAGAPAPSRDIPESDPRDHWAFKSPLKKQIKGTANPIDYFLNLGWEQNALKPQSPADKRTLLRRVFLDLTGLPPLEDDYRQFLEDTSPEAYSKVVDRLLASKQYSERWARHWMDVWRYSDWWGLGAELRNSQKHIWHWRDWIMESLDKDVAYDEMIRQMLAADELYPADESKLRATGYLARQYFKFNRNSWMEETLEHTFKGFMGITINCVRCHDHKYDPIAQTEYYNLRAFFEPYQVRGDMVAGEADFEKNAIPRVFDCNLEAPTWFLVRGDEKNPKKDASIPPALPAFLSSGPLKLTEVKLPPEAHSPQLKKLVLENAQKQAREKISQATKALEEGKKETSKTPPEKLQYLEKNLEVAQAEEKALEPRWNATRLKVLEPASQAFKEASQKAAMLEKLSVMLKAEADLMQGKLELAGAAKGKEDAAKKKVEASQKAFDAAKKASESPGDVFTPLKGSLKTLESNLENETSRNKPFPTTSTGRRTALAGWMTSRENPLTARVAVNHMWVRHFGKPLVATIFDFGRKGSLPTHPELLDWLAVDFMQHGWSMKHLHRIMITSKAYQMSSSNRGAEANASKDPENKYLWRMNPRRLESQAVRDSQLVLSGQLDFTFGGPSIPSAQQTLSTRRAIYFFQSHNDHDRFLSQFDDANVLECYRREESILPQQALTLANSGFTLDRATGIHQRLTKEPSLADQDKFLDRVFELVLGTQPTMEERAACSEAMDAWRKASPEKGRDRLLLIHSILNHNDFITVR